MSTTLFWNRSRRSHQLHPHMVTLRLDTVDWGRFRGFFADDMDVVIVDARLDADRVVVEAGCSSAEVADRLHDAWA